MRLRVLGPVVVATAALLGTATIGTATAATLGTVHTFGENNLGQRGGDGLQNVAAIAANRDNMADTLQHSFCSQFRPNWASGASVGYWPPVSRVASRSRPSV